MSLRLMTVHAHPDDESSKGAATLAHYRDRGAEVMVVSCTGGERGDILNPLVEADPQAHRDLPGVRRLEMERARDILDVQHRWLGYRDSGMAREDGTVPADSFADISPDISVRPLVRLIRSFRPQVLITYDENGGYPHPDHIRCHEISVRAFDLAADPAFAPELGEAWSIDKLYYDTVFRAARFQAMYDALIALDPERTDLEPLAGMLERRASRPDRTTTQIPVGAFFERRDEALRAHRSQIPEGDGFFFWSNDLQREVWPVEDFERVRSRVTLPDTDTESDLFAGIETD